MVDFQGVNPLPPHNIADMCDIFFYVQTCCPRSSLHWRTIGPAEMRSLPCMASQNNGLPTNVPNRNGKAQPGWHCTHTLDGRNPANQLIS